MNTIDYTSNDIEYRAEIDHGTIHIYIKRGACYIHEDSFTSKAKTEASIRRAYEAELMHQMRCTDALAGTLACASDCDYESQADYDANLGCE